ncbi:amidohydrolase family protein [Alteromonas sp. C1M14]|uniref:amidohydrolase family protein n=1 Tax=Alteromonas sp. C1M14 TaxID=2841567 RepID=UPI001C08E1FB|nr:amidohydrolase family protein [Alteromonas sp. C1M14]MBU2977466.1 amidohydrolase family protein [Alteromonas sp. C1M14]
MKRILSLAIAAALSTSAFAENIAIVGGKILTQTEQGTIESGTVLIRDGKIQSVSEQGEVPDGYTRIDASGKVVTPGFIGALTSLGLVEVSSWAGEVDSSVGDSAISHTGAALDPSYAINPDSSLIDITRIEGFTTAGTSIERTDLLFRGQGAVISLDDDGQIVKNHSFMVVNMTGSAADEHGGSRTALWVLLESVLNEASSTSSVPSLTTTWEGINTRADLQALKAVIDGSVPLFIQADRSADIRQVLAFKKRHPDIKLVLVHGAEAWRVADELAAADIPVILDPQANLPSNFDQVGSTLHNAGRLEKAGVKVAIGIETHNIRLASQHAGNAVANGLSYEAGIASLTSVPAQILGVDDKVGALAPGLQADVVIWSGDPLEVTEAAEQVFIDGEAIDMTSRQTRLRDRYLKVQANPNGETSHYVKP